MSELQREVKRKKRIIEYADPAPTPDRDISETGNYAKSVARREGFASSLRLLRPATPLVASLPLCGTQDGTQHRKRHPGGTKMGPPELGASPSLKWKDCDSSAMAKTQVEFLARARTERKALNRSPKIVPVGSPMIRASAVID